MGIARAAITAATAAVCSAVFAREPNYDEAKVSPYTLEDPLVFADGRKVTSALEWQARRAEILDIFAREMYGQPPPAPETVVTELLEEGATLAGLAIRRQYRMWFRRDKSGPFIDWLLVLPNRIDGVKPKNADGHVVCENCGKVPVVLMLNYRGNHAVLDDSEVPLPEKATNCVYGDELRRPQESFRGFVRRSSSRTTIPVEALVARGYAFLTANYAQVSPDPEPADESLAYTGVFSLWPMRDPTRDDNTTSLGAWAWALSRGLDLAERISEIDARRCVVTGSSRLAKAALLAAARDERFAVCVPNQTGGGGCPLAKRDFGENVSTEMKMFPHWYCKAYAKYVDNEQSMKFDQHLLLAAIAPRRLLVEGFNEGWFDTKGEYLACRAASPTWKFLGKEGLPEGDFPANYDICLVGSFLGYVRRGGMHGLSVYDWLWMLDFADNAFAGDTSHSEMSVNARDFCIRDPFVLVDGGRYYLYESKPWKGGRGVFVREGVNLEDWTEKRPVMTCPDYFPVTAVWAPEVHKYNGRYYMFVTLTFDTEKLSSVLAPEEAAKAAKRGTWVFVADTPRGPFAPVRRGPVPPVERQTLDGTLYVEDGQPYMVYCHEWGQIWNGTIEYAPLSDDFASFTSEPVEMLKAENAVPGAGRITDGPFFWRSEKSSRLYMIWSNFIPEGYCVLVRSSPSGRIAGPWSKDEVLSADNGGHGMIFKDLDGILRLVMHEPNIPEGAERMRVFELIDDGEKLKLVARHSPPTTNKENDK